MTLKPYQTSLFNPSDMLMLSVEDFRAKLSRLQGIDGDSKIQEELYSLKSQGSHLFSNLEYCFLKMSKGYSAMTKEEHLKSSCKRWMNWGYNVEWQVLNSKDFGVPQNRERVFIIGHLRGEGGRKVFPIDGQIKNVNCVRQIGNLIQTLSYGGNPHRGRVYSLKGISPSLNCMGGGGREPKIRIKEATKKGYAEATIGDSVNLSHPNSKTRRGRVGKQIANTLLTGEEQGVVMHDFRIRKLTPKECWRLQGFPDWAFKRAAKVNSNSQLYKQAGNSVTVNVIEAIARRLV